MGERRFQQAQPTRAHRTMAVNLAKRYLSGNKRSEAIEWLNGRRISRLDVAAFIDRMQRAYGGPKDGSGRESSQSSKDG